MQMAGSKGLWAKTPKAVTTLELDALDHRTLVHLLADLCHWAHDARRVITSWCPLSPVASEPLPLVLTC